MKTKIVRLGTSGAVRTREHVRYLERDGVTPPGDRQCLYSSHEDHADGRSFARSCAGDRHQFRLVILTGAADDFEDLKPLTRRFMGKMEFDLDTSLEWLATDHADTAHPHTHVILRGKDDRGEDLIISPSYINTGMTTRLTGIVSLGLGPPSDNEFYTPLRLEVEAERPTWLDQQLVEQMDSAREIAPCGRNLVEHALLNGRLQKLGALGLAERISSGHWRLSDSLEMELRAIGERHERARVLHAQLDVAGLDRATAEQVIHSSDANVELTGRIVAAPKTSEARDNSVVLDAVDGRIHSIDLGSAAPPKNIHAGAIVHVTVETGGIEKRDKAVIQMALLSPVPLEDLAVHDGATWLDRELVSPTIAPRDLGFGREVRSALAQRRTWLIEHGFAVVANGKFACRRDMLERLQKRELMRIAAELETDTAHVFVPVDESSPVEGVLRRRLELPSGRFAVIDNGHQFSLVPWQPIFDDQLGKRVRGAVAATGMGWTLGHQREIDL